jgi:hypothetical protein
MTGRVFTLGTFGEALEALKQGLRVQRADWPSGVSLELYVPGAPPLPDSEGYRPITGKVPAIYVRDTFMGTRSEYHPEHSEVLARDWHTV